jgi:hypothetical protein
MDGKSPPRRLPIARVRAIAAVPHHAVANPARRTQSTVEDCGQLPPTGVQIAAMIDKHKPAERDERLFRPLLAPRESGGD